MKMEFANKLLLTLHPSLEERYETDRWAKVSKYNTYLSLFSMLYTVIGIIFHYVFHRDPGTLNESLCNILIIVSFTELGLRCLFLFVSLIFKNIKLRSLCNYFNYFLISVTTICIKGTLTASNEFLSDNLGVFCVTIECILRLLTMVIGCVNVFAGSVVTIISLLVTVAQFVPLCTTDKCRNNNYLNLIGYCIFLLYIIALNYFIVYFLKSPYYYEEDMRKKMKLLENILENINSGFIRISNQEITYANKKLYDILLKTECGKRLVQNQNEHMVYSVEMSKEILNELLSDIKIETLSPVVDPDGHTQSNKNLLIPSTDALLISIGHAANVINHFRTKFGSDGNFNFIGNKTISIHNDDGNDDITYEIFCKFQLAIDDPSKAKSLSENYELVFNDISRVKSFEERKYKTVFLSKVAHEFKNPIICIIELVNQICDSFKNLTIFNLKTEDIPEDISIQKEMANNLKQIASLSNYLLILTKDLDFFSKKELTKKRIDIEIEECDVEEIMCFCEEIAKSLLKKYGRINDVEFQVSFSNSPKKVYTDEQRLKQVLINLISNAIKFTANGFVKLEAVKGNDEVTFTVSDSGKGIKEEDQKMLFMPFNNSTPKCKLVDNSTGSGLGMSIIYELTSALGKSIQFTSTVGKGSTFWFSIPIKGIEVKQIRIMNRQRAIGHTSSPKEGSKISNRKKSVFYTNFKSLVSELYLKSERTVSNQEHTEKKKYSAPNINDSELSINTSSRMIIEDPEKETMKSNENEVSNNHTVSTVRIDDMPMNIDKNEILNYCHPPLSKRASNNKILKSSTISSIVGNYFQAEQGTMNIVICDDEELTRHSTMRILKSISAQMNIAINLYEAEDGVECLYLIYLFHKKGIKISFILSDQTMPFLTGSSTSIILDKYAIMQTGSIPFYIITAYEDEDTVKLLMNYPIAGIFTKPMTKRIAEKLFLNK